MLCQYELINCGDWDILIVLDACRYDIFSEVNWIEGKLYRAWSTGNKTPQWLSRTFLGNWPDTAYLSANPFVAVNYSDADNVCGVNYAELFGWKASRFGYVDKVWCWGREKIKGWYTVHPESIITSWEKNKGKFSRYIIHFMQPHTPFIGKKYIQGDAKEYMRTKEIYRLMLREFGVSVYISMYKKKHGAVEDVIEMYASNLEFVLEYVDRLLNDTSDYRVVITSDHGELLGEGGQYGHYMNEPIPILREVPWLEVK